VLRVVQPIYYKQINEYEMQVKNHTAPMVDGAKMVLKLMLFEIFLKWHLTLSEKETWKNKTPKHYCDYINFFHKTNEIKKIEDYMNWCCKICLHLLQCL